jgi:heme exporter protein A
MTTPGTFLVCATGLTALRGERALFRSVDLTLGPGQCVILRGANGSGKTTLLRILAGLTRPDAGEIVRNGPLHWIGHRDGLKPSETPRTHLQLWAQAWGSQADIEEVLESQALRRPADVHGRYLSAGQRRRTALARLMLDKRPVWLLDEPYTALDSASRSRLDKSIEAHLEHAGAVIACMHDTAGFRVSAEVNL